MVILILLVCLLRVASSNGDYDPTIAKSRTTKAIRAKLDQDKSTVAPNKLVAYRVAGQRKVK